MKSFPDAFDDNHETPDHRFSLGYVSWPRLQEARLIVAVYYTIDNHVDRTDEFQAASYRKPHDTGYPQM